MDEYFVAYVVDGCGHCTAGPYTSQEEALAHAADIEGFERVSNVQVVRHLQRSREHSR